MSKKKKKKKKLVAVGAVTTSKSPDGPQTTPDNHGIAFCYKLVAEHFEPSVIRDVSLDSVFGLELKSDFKCLERLLSSFLDGETVELEHPP